LSRFSDILASFRNATADRNASLNQAKPNASILISGGKSVEQGQGGKVRKKARVENSGGTSDARFSFAWHLSVYPTLAESDPVLVLNRPTVGTELCINPDMGDLFGILVRCDI
jgi:hypothetical protein